MFTNNHKLAARCRMVALIFLTFVSLYAVPLAVAGPGCSPTATGC
jgi:hypothetical protein